MKVSYNWLKDYIKADITPEKMAEVLTAIGLETEGIEVVETIPGGLKGVVVGHVLTREKHPDADRLSITTVDLGTEAPVQIVCGAPNVAAGQKVLVATVGTTLYPSSGEPFTIKKSKIRGAESIGMICAEDELGLGESHVGIMVLDEQAVVGTPAAQYLNISTDYCLEIGLTPNRTDAFSHFGVARDLHAALKNSAGNHNIASELNMPSTSGFNASTTASPVEIVVENTEDAPRYAGVVMNNIKVAASPKWLQERLSAIGLRPINNVVDITNYVQHEIGQPLHAFDLAAIKGNKVVVRRGKNGEKFVTLDGTERTLADTDLMICNSEAPMCIAGVFGGKDSGVSENTTSIFIESAYFNPSVVRKTARRHVLNTDASFRFERGANPDSVIWAIQRCAALIAEIAGGEVASSIVDLYPNKIEPAAIVFNPQRADVLIGMAIPRDRMRSILKDLDFSLEEKSETEWNLTAPLYRADVKREADVVEEILRIYGFDYVEFPKGLKSSMSFAPQPDPERVQNRVADFLSDRGFSEIMSMSLTKTKYAELFPAGNVSAESQVNLLNPLSSDLGSMRQTLLFTGLEAISLNRNHRNSDLRLYEFGNVYSKKGERSYHEEKHLSIYVSGKKSPENWNVKSESVSFFDIKWALEEVFRGLGLMRDIRVSMLIDSENICWKNVENFQDYLLKMALGKLDLHSHRQLGSDYFETAQHENLKNKFQDEYSNLVPADSYFDEGLEFIFKKQRLAVAGRVHPRLSNYFGIKDEIMFADINWSLLLNVLPNSTNTYQPIDKFPSVRRDLSLLVDRGITFQDIEKLAFESERKLLRQVGLFDVYEGKNLEAGKKSYAVSFVLQDPTKTMTDTQVEQAMSRIQKALEDKLGAALRS